MTEVLGSRTPRLRVVPPYTDTRGPEVVEVAALAGLELDPWQCDGMDDTCALGPDGVTWNTLENVEIVPRQNGKGGEIEALKLGHLFVFDSRLIVYSAHRFDTSREMFMRTATLVQDTPALSRRVKRIYEANGKEGIELKTGARLMYQTRSDKAARGLASDAMLLDEAFKLDSPMMGAIMPTLSARPNPQLVYLSSSGWEISTQLGKLRRRALAALLWQLLNDGVPLEAAAAHLGLPQDEAARLQGKATGPVDPSLCFREWSAPDTTPRTKSVMADRRLQAMANPALGIRITPSFVDAELRTMSPTEFGRERLGIGDYPPDPDEDDGWGVIPEAKWARRALPGGDRPWPGETGVRRVAFAADVRPDRTMAAIGAAFRDEQGQLVLELINHAAGTGWVVPRLRQLADKYKPVAVAIDTVGPAASMIPELTQHDVPVLELTTGDIAQAYGSFYEAATEDDGDLAHLDQEPLNDAVQGAATRPLGDRLTWDRRAGVDISPLVAVTNAAHAHRLTAHEDTDPLNNIW